MTDPHFPEPDGYRRVREQHESLNALLQQIDRALEDRVAIEEIAHLIGQLGDRIVAHFTMEEAGGYFSEAILHSPRLVVRANALMAQHPKLSEKARQMAERTMAEAGSQLGWHTTRQRFDAFRESLMQHERSEDRLLQEAYSQDIGSHD